jgi:exopolyphosphatase/guanosine-5'-triphosphate,3'-diphosphate pyrophosphatase
MMNTDIFGAIDIGSNAIRLLINNIEEDKSSPDFKKVAYLRVPIRLGDDAFTKGRISEDKKYRLIHAMQGFSHIMKAFGVMDYRACATSAMRDAGNGKDIVEAIRIGSGINVEIISGREEAEIIYEAGELDRLMDKKRNYLYVDVGGGSTEIVVYSNQQKVTSNSFQLGTVRMLVDAVQEKEGQRFKTWLKDVYKEHGPLSIIASGGNINKIHKVLGKREREPLSYAELKAFYDTIKTMSYEERIQTFKLNTYRADVIVPALKIFLTISRICKVEQIYVPKIGLADGIIHHLYFERKK